MTTSTDSFSIVGFDGQCCVVRADHKPVDHHAGLEERYGCVLDGPERIDTSEDLWVFTVRQR